MGDRYVSEERKMTHVTVWEIKDLHDHREVVCTIYYRRDVQPILDFLNSNWKSK